MTKEEFVKRKIEFDRKDRRFNRTFMAVFFGSLLLNIPLVSRVPEFYEPLYWVGFCLFFLVSFAVLFWGGLNQAKHAGLICRSCEGGLLNWRGDDAVATGICSHCGDRPFDETPSAL
jgi:hypothetical protein